MSISSTPCSAGGQEGLARGSFPGDERGSKSHQAPSGEPWSVFVSEEPKTGSGINSAS